MKWEIFHTDIAQLVDELKAAVGKQTEMPVALRCLLSLSREIGEELAGAECKPGCCFSLTACTGAGWALIQSLQPELCSLLLLFKNNN